MATNGRRDSSGAGTENKVQSERAGVAWRKSGFCQSGECVEVAALDEAVLVRDSKHPGHVLTYSSDEFRAFVLGVKAGEFDDLIAPASS
ncbi:MAG TPA: DUF397 domain-containing protein [Streptosporangiaceae bacterium]